jgi:hypothetical protein
LLIGSFQNTDEPEMPEQSLAAAHIGGAPENRYQISITRA